MIIIIIIYTYIYIYIYYACRNKKQFQLLTGSRYANIWNFDTVFQCKSNSSTIVVILIVIVIVI